MNCKKFRRRRVLLSVLFLILVFLGIHVKTIYSHAPARFWLAYEFETETLSIDIEHPRMYPDIHYIDNVVVWKNDIIVRNETYTSQPGDNYHLYFVINATHMDVFKAFGRCCIGGNATDTITVYDPDKPIPTNTTGYSACFIIYLGLFGIGLTVLPKLFKRKIKM